VQNVRLPVADHLVNPLGQYSNFPPFAYRRRPLDPGQSAEEMEPICFFLGLLRDIAMLVLTHAGHAGHGQSAGNLRLHDRSRAKAIAAVQGQAVVENVQNSRHRTMACQKRINVPSTQSLYRAKSEERVFAARAGMNWVDDRQFFYRVNAWPVADRGLASDASR